MASTAPKLIVEPACCVCGKKDGLRLCSMCNAVHYCSKAHQKSDRLDHKGPCHLIKKFRGKIDFLWGEMEEPPLDEAEFILVQLKYLHDNIISELVKIPTSKAMRMAIDFAEGCPHYPISELGPLEGILDHLPFAHLRLGKDQYSLDLLGCLATLRWPTDDFDDHQG